MTAAVMLAAFVAALAALLLAIPVDFACRARAEHVVDGDVRIQWLFGLVRLHRRWDASIDAADAGSADPIEPRDEKPAIPARRVLRPAPAARCSRRPLPAFMRTAAGRRRAWRLLRVVLRGTALRRLEARLQIGLDDPADTGRLMGALLPLVMSLRPLLPGALEVTPDFTGERLHGRVEAALRVIPIRVIGPIFWFGAWTLRGRPRIGSALM